MSKIAIMSALCACALAVACGEESSNTDGREGAQKETEDAGAGSDHDAAADGGGSGDTAFADIGKACDAKSDCGVGLTCLDAATQADAFGGYVPRGLCTKKCESNDDCGDDGACEPNDESSGWCVERCKVGPMSLPDEPLSASKCHGRGELACLAEVGSSDGQCLPSCGTDADCAEGTYCSLARGSCVDDAPDYETIGAACSVSDPGACGVDMLCLPVAEDMGICTASCTWGRPFEESCGGAKNGSCLYFDTEDTGAGDYAYCSPSCEAQSDCLDFYLSCTYLLGQKGCFGTVPCPNGHDDCAGGERCVETKDGPSCVPLSIPFGDYDQCKMVGHYEVCTLASTGHLTGLTWSRYLSGDEKTYEDAEAYCKDMLGGGARLPTDAELRELLDATQSGAPFIDVDALADTPSTPMWTSTADPQAAGNHLVVSFGAADGNAASASLARTEVAAFRCVHD